MLKAKDYSEEELERKREEAERKAALEDLHLVPKDRPIFANWSPTCQDKEVDGTRDTGTFSRAEHEYIAQVDLSRLQALRSVSGRFFKVF